jgi:hypothetical protein
VLIESVGHRVLTLAHGRLVDDRPSRRGPASHTVTAASSAPGATTAGVTFSPERTGGGDGE